MTFTESISTCFKKYATFKGRASRSEFWWFQLFLFLMGILLNIIGILIFGTDSPAAVLLSNLFSWGILLPQLAVTCRRLHDTDRSGWWQVLPLGILFVGSILYFIILLSTGDAIFIGSVITIAFLITGIRLLIWLIESGDWGDNEYGPSPIIEEEDSETETQAEQ
jgi:uncharacterized membrane protein YhaH (DUF805 family)